MFKHKTFLLAVLFLFTEFTSAQCAMCKAVVESGDAEIAEGLNDGIVYLMVFPYLLLGVVGYLIYRARKKELKKSD
ncbi:MAG: hypothetical protein CR985_02695 [Flavobacteriales bacterium]|nr:MAG: hypothetical protein CR985_02695 [Flavobacteriales bacterium]